MPRTASASTALALAMTMVLAALAVPAWPAAPHRAGLRPLHTLPAGQRGLPVPPDTEMCRTLFDVSCYRPAQLQRAYHVAALHAAGLDGRGRTIAVVVAFGSPTIDADLDHFDATFGLPAPPSLRVIAPAGAPPTFDPQDPDMAGWAAETTLDVEAAHLMAPAASILVVATPVSETEGLQGFPEIARAERFVIERHLADVVSQSFGATEETFGQPAPVLGLRSVFESARRERVTLLAAAGDTGATGPYLDGTCCYPSRVIGWPSSDPLVTSVGGTQLRLDAAGARTAPDRVWNDGANGAAGGGTSAIFRRPAFQDGLAVRGVVGDARGTPDVSLSAAIDGGLVIYWSFSGPGAAPGYHVVGGTSEASPLLSGMVAIAAQIRGGRLGWINPALYRLAASGPAAGIVDVTVGDNDGTFLDRNGHAVTVAGYEARPGYDLASGLGTVDAARFCRALAAAA